MSPSEIKYVPVLNHFSGSVSCSSSNRFGVEAADVIVTGPGGTFTASCGGSPSYNETSSSLFTVGSPVFVSKEVDVEFVEYAVLGRDNDFSLSATADPTFEIDPSFPYASDFQLEYDVDDGSTVTDAPEPATWTLLAVAVVGLACWRRTRTPSLAKH